jgi:hypothetical protein
MSEVNGTAYAGEDTAETDEQEAAGRKRGGGFFRFLFIGLILGAALALFSRRGGGDDDEDFGEENWIEVKHEDSGTGASVPTATPNSDVKPAEAGASGEA